VHGLEGIPAFDEAPGQVFEQFGFAGPFSQLAEIAGCPDDPSSEVLCPDAVYHDASRQRMVAIV